VTLSAPEGTTPQVMNRTLESIRTRVDAFGVAEPDIFVTGTNIEVQIPGLADGTIRERRVEETCLIGSDEENFGCFGSPSEADDALAGIKAKAQPERFCLLDPDGRELQCLASQKEADSAVDALNVQQEGEQFCLRDKAGQNLACYATEDEAQAGKDDVTVQRSQEFCVLDGEGRSLGCFGAKEQAQAVVDAIGPADVTSKFCVVSSSGRSLGCFLSRARAQARLQETGQDRLIQLIGTTARLEEREVLATLTPGTPGIETTEVTCDTEAERAEPACSFQALEDQEVVFLGEDGATKFRLGPVRITGDAIQRATAVFRTPSQNDPTATQGWAVDFQLTSEGSGLFGDVTTELVGRQLAIILDQQVISAPVINEPITGGSGTISGSFTEQEARDLATTLNAGALPVQLTQQQLVTVSPTLGDESLRQGIIAAAVGLVALTLYLVFYYRLLGVVAFAGMLMWALLAIALVSIAGDAFGYALTLAGVAGLVISLGITADSYIVFFERLKDEVRSGKTPRSAVQPAFKRSYKTIVAADVVTGLAAAGLYVTAVSSVRGFALTLGVATLLDLFVVYFFKRPTVFLISRNARLVGLRGFGLRSGVAADETSVPSPAPVAGGSE
jgi:preprotein translocase subunit SecD